MGVQLLELNEKLATALETLKVIGKRFVILLPNILKLCSPNVRDVHTTSLMPAGHVFLPCHVSYEPAQKVQLDWRVCNQEL